MLSGNGTFQLNGRNLIFWAERFFFFFKPKGARPVLSFYFSHNHNLNIPLLDPCVQMQNKWVSSNFN